MHAALLVSLFALTTASALPQSTASRELTRPPLLAADAGDEGPGRVPLGLSSGARIGAAFHLLPGLGEATLGVAIEGLSALRFTEGFSARLRLTLGITHWERAAAAAAVGNSIGQWTTGAYADVTRWLITGDPAWAMFKLIGAFFAYVGLAFTYVAAGLAYAVAPIVAASFAELGLSGAAHWVVGAADLFLEGGAGTLFYVDREAGQIYPGWGPLVGLGMDAGFLSVAAHLVWSPAALNQTRTSDVGAGAVTLRLRL